MPLPGESGLNGLSPSVRATFLAGGAARSAKPLGPESEMAVSLVLHFRDAPRLDALLARLASVPRSDRRGYLTNTAFDRAFGPTAQTVSSISRYLRQRGVDVGSLEGFDLPLRGTARVIGGAFHTRFATTKKSYFTLSRPELPSELASSVSVTTGFDSFPVAASNVVRGAGIGHLAHPANLTSQSGLPVLANNADPNDGPAAGDWNLNALGSTYGVNNLLSSGDNGNGATVAVYELEPYNPNDVAEFDSYFNLASNVANPTVMTNGTSTPGSTSTSNLTDVSIPSSGTYFPVASTDATTINNYSDGNGDTEADLDIEQVQSQSPDTNIDVYGAQNTGAGEWNEWMALISPASFVAGFPSSSRPVVPTTPPAIITTSWGLCEVQGDSSGLDQLFEEAAAQGQTILAAAGDKGSQDCANGSQAELGLDYPSSSPYVTAVGGTANFGDNYETAWSDPNSDFGSGYGGGGGLSDVFAEPAWEDSTYPETASSSSSCSPSVGAPSACRASPDISANAGIGENVVAEGGWQEIGGTSAAAPLVAGLLADAASSCTTTGGHFVGGELAPEIDAAYRAGGEGTDFTDITVGGNDATDPSGTTYLATSGYDLASGVGVPIASGFACPTIETMSEVGGSTGDSVVISGTNLENATIDFGGVQVPTTNASSTSVTVTVPDDQGSSATVAVTAATPFAVSGQASFVYGSYRAGAPPTTTSTTTTTTTSIPQSTTTTTALAAVTTTAPDGSLAGTSGFAPSRVAALRLSASAYRFRAASDVIVIVRAPTHSATPVTLQLRYGSRWRAISHVIVSGGMAAVTLDFESPGTYLVRALVQANGSANYSNIDHLVVIARRAHAVQSSKSK